MIGSLLKKIGKVDLIWLFLILWILFVGTLNLRFKCMAYDENVHLTYGARILFEHNSDRLDYREYVDDSKMPVTVLNALPSLIVGNPVFETPDGLNVRSNAIISGRLMLVLFACFLGNFIFCWSRRWYGQGAGYLSLFLFALCPNILAHSQIISTDVYSAGFVAFASYFFWKFMERGGWKEAGASAVVLGLAQLTKFSCLFLYPIFLLILAARYIRDFDKNGFGWNWPKIGADLARFFKFAVFFIFISLLIINAGYLFNKTMTPLRDYQFSSPAFQGLQEDPVLGALPLPLPYPYVQGIDRSIFNVKTGASIGNLYLLGQLQEARTPEYKGFKGYYFIVSLFKVPIATLIIFFMSIWFYGRNFKRFDFWGREIHIIVPALFFMILLNYFNRMQIGIRHFLIIFPLLYIFCGSLIAEGVVLQKRFLRFALMGLGLYLVVSVCSYYRYFISYMNEFTLDRMKSYKIVADSNLDMGCDCLDQKEYLDQHSKAILEPSQPVAGEVVVGVNKLVGIFDKEKYRWLRENFEPSGRIAYSYLIYHVDEKDLKKIRLP